MEAFFTVKGVRYRLVSVDDWTFEEASEAKRISGVPQALIPKGWIENDPDIIRGVLLVSMRRVDPSLTEAVFVGEKPSEIMGSLEAIDEPEDKPPDPQTASLSESGGSGADISASQTTLDGTGTQVGSGASA